MSPLKERKERICLNCNTPLQGRYCHVCGQENTEPKESLWSLIVHYFNDFTHFDGKFFSTLKWLILKPGFLSKQYIIGKRASYLNPIRMYIFTSAFFFLIFFNFLKPGSKIITNTISGKTIDEVAKMDSASFAVYTTGINKKNGKGATSMSRDEFKKYADSLQSTGIHFTDTIYKSKAAYDSLVKIGVKKHSWLQRILIYKEIEINEKFKNNKALMITSFEDKLLHSVPQMLFISLPVFALFLKLVYIRRKQFYYVNHIIFSIHLYIFLFIALLCLFGLGKLNSQLSLTLLSAVNVVLLLGIFFYQYRAMLHFYQQGWAKTLVKFLLLNFLCFVSMVFLFTAFVFFSFFKL